MQASHLLTHFLGTRRRNHNDVIIIIGTPRYSSGDRFMLDMEANIVWFHLLARPTLTESAKTTIAVTLNA